ncbi:MAG: hypothetical protein WKF86_10185, partial [Acidimicrobiales bacterium]
IRPGWTLTVPGHPAPTAAAAQPGPAGTPPPAAQDAPGRPDDRPDPAGASKTPDIAVDAGDSGTASSTAPPVSEPAPPPAAATPPRISPPVTAAQTTWPPSPPPTRSSAQPAGTAPTPTSTATGPSEPARAPQEPQETPGEQAAPATTAADSEDPSGRVALPWGLASAGLAAAAVVGLVSRRRHRQIGLRRPGRRPPLPTGDAALAETALRVGANPAGATLVDEALAAVAAAVEVDGAGLPEILGAHLTGNRVELLLASPFGDVAEPFEASADGLAWSAASADVVGFVARVDCCCPAPTMVTLGETGDGTLLVTPPSAFRSASPTHRAPPPNTQPPGQPHQRPPPARRIVPTSICPLDQQGALLLGRKARARWGPSISHHGRSIPKRRCLAWALGPRPEHALRRWERQLLHCSCSMPANVVGAEGAASA